MSTKTPDPKPLYAITKTTFSQTSSPSPSREQEATNPPGGLEGEEEEEEEEEEQAGEGEGEGEEEEEEEEDRITSTEIHAIYADREAANRAARVLLREVAARAGRLGSHGNPLGRYGESMGEDFMYFGELVWCGEGVQEGRGWKRRRRRVEVRVLGVLGYL